MVLKIQSYVFFQNWNPHRAYTVLSYTDPSQEKLTNGKDCSQYLGISWHELQLIRQEEEKQMFANGKKSLVTKTLLLGDLHTEPARQKEYRPTAYQPPLINIETVINTLKLFGSYWAKGKLV